MATDRPAPVVISSSARLAIVAARWNAEIVEALLRQAVERCGQAGVTPHVVRVPGAFELPVAARWCADAGFDAVICLGCVIRGDTPHFDYVAGEAARGCQAVSLQTGVPVIFGVLTVNTQQQAIDRTDGTHSFAGRAAAEAALEMAALRDQFRATAGG
jgi:6,7-dimethyl-8-ribityllumazine synthase